MQEQHTQTIAIPRFETRIAPRFDCARLFTFAVCSDGEVVSEGEWACHTSNAGLRVRELRDRGTDVLICGGIHGQSATYLQHYGVQVIPWITGEYKDALDCYLRGELDSHSMIGHGGSRCGRWRFRRGCRREDIQ